VETCELVLRELRWEIAGAGFPRPWGAGCCLPIPPSVTGDDVLFLEGLIGAGRTAAGPAAAVNGTRSPGRRGEWVECGSDGSGEAFQAELYGAAELSEKQQAARLARVLGQAGRP
jgi:hypothetical protein